MKEYKVKTDSASAAVWVENNHQQQNAKESSERCRFMIERKRPKQEHDSCLIAGPGVHTNWERSYISTDVHMITHFLL